MHDRLAQLVRSPLNTFWAEIEQPWGETGGQSRASWDGNIAVMLISCNMWQCSTHACAGKRMRHGRRAEQKSCFLFRRVWKAVGGALEDLFETLTSIGQALIRMFSSMCFGQCLYLYLLMVCHLIFARMYGVSQIYHSLVSELHGPGICCRSCGSQCALETSIASFVSRR